MWDTRDGTIIKDLLTGITGVWQVVFDERFCVAASNRQDQTYLDVWDFAGEDDDNADIEAAKIGEEDEETDDEDDYPGMAPMDEWNDDYDANGPDSLNDKDDDDDQDSPTTGRAKFELGPSPSPLGRRVGSNTGSLGLGVAGSSRLPMPPTTTETPTRPRVRNVRTSGPRY
jgi:F-box and WD-40 domain protein CDC4